MREDEQLRSVSFFASNYNCCEMFYKMKKGIECKENEVELKKILIQKLADCMNHLKH